jgi:hypothetical protein
MNKLLNRNSGILKKGLNYEENKLVKLSNLLALNKGETLSTLPDLNTF